MEQYLVTFGLVAAAVFGSIHVLDTFGASARANVIFGGVLGVMSGIVCQGAGWIQSPHPGVWAYVSAGFFGLISTFVAMGATRKSAVDLLPPKPL